jgi:hypothetical protein
MKTRACGIMSATVRRQRTRAKKENTRALIGNHRFKANASKNLIDLMVESRKIRGRLETGF